MLILPYGHDRYAHSRPWLTIGFIAVNVVVFAVCYLLKHGVEQSIEATFAEVAQVHQEYPEARVGPSALAPLPPPLRPVFSKVVTDSDFDDGDDGDQELSRAIRKLSVHVDSLPSLRFGYRPGRPRAVTLMTSLFMHGDIFHLLGNMLFLYLLGMVIESFWGGLPYVLLYFVAGMAGTLAHHLATPESLVPLVGASGAIAGLMGAFVMGHPRSRIKLFYAFWVIRPYVGVTSIPAWALIPGWLLMQVGLAVLIPGDGVAHFAHVGGFAAGVLGTLLMRWTGWITYDADEVLGR